MPESDLSDDASQRSAAAGLTYHRGMNGLARWTDAAGLAGLAARAAAVAAVAVAACLAWVPPGLFKMFLLAAALQWAVVGVGMRRALRAARVRSRSIAFVFTVGAAVAAVASLYPGLYLWNVVRVYRQLGGGGGNVARAFRIYDLYLTGRTGRGGLPGFLAMTLPHLSGLAFLHVVGTPWAAWRVARSHLRSAHCPACGQWLPAPRNAAVVPVTHALPLVQAVAAGDVAATLAVVTDTAGSDLGSQCVVARGYRCAACGVRSVDVVTKAFGRRGGQSVVVPPVAVTEPLYDALRSEPVVAVPADPTGVDADS